MTRFLVVGSAALFACGSTSPPDSTNQADSSNPPHVAWPCDDSLAAAFEPDINTRVLEVQAFEAGDPLQLDPSVPSVGTAPVDMCLVKLLIGPGNPGPANAPSTSAGIGIEVWLPNVANWDAAGNILRVFGSSGWAGGFQADPTRIGNTSTANPTLQAWMGAVQKGYVVSTSDHGHGASNATGGNGSFALNEDGSINTVLWRDFADRSLHELADKTKALANAYYGKPHRYAYWDGFSTGGRQAYAIAQNYPTDFDGILAGAPAFNWTKFIVAELYPQIVMQRELGGPLASSKQNAVNGLAVAACGGTELGFLLDPMQCRYDPAKDPAALCSSTHADPSTCLTLGEAQAVNKIWYGQTTDGSYVEPSRDPDPLKSSRPPAAEILASNHLWYGLPRGTQFAVLAGATPFPIASAYVALVLRDASYAQSVPVNTLTNANGDNLGADRWKTLDYGALANTAYQGRALQSQFADIDADDPDLTELPESGAKLLHYHGWTDNFIMAQGSVNYYERVAAHMGGVDEVREFDRLFLIPGLGHSVVFTATGAVDATGAPLAAANVPLPQHTVIYPTLAPGEDTLFMALRNWVEKGVAPERIELRSQSGAVSLPICAYPKQAVHDGVGPVTVAGSYACK